MIDWDLISIYSKAQLQQIATKLALRVNKKIEKLGKSGIANSAAYNKLKAFLGAPYISEKKRKGKKYAEIRLEPQNAETVGQLRELISVADSFNNSKTSTLRGIKETNKNKRRALQEKFGNFSSDAEADAFLRFLGTPEARAAMKQFDSNIVVTAIQRASKREPDRDLRDIWKEFEESGKTFGDWIIENEELMESEGFEF